ncbi:MAG: phospholipase/carboxylesterase [Oceanospirillaceae bacterium]
MQLIIKDTHASPDAAVIWLHGLGADGNDFVPAIPHLQLTQDIKVRFVFPSAPERAVTINNGMQMRSWYDIKAMLPQRVTDEQQLQESVGQVAQLVADLVDQGIAAKRILVVGFSQGGAVAYELALTTNSNVAGVAAMSTYLPRSLAVEQCLADKSLAILSIHGDHDNVVPCALGESGVANLKALGFNPQWHTFAMDHEVTAASLTLLGEWITAQLAN